MGLGKFFMYRADLSLDFTSNLDLEANKHSVPAPVLNPSSHLITDQKNWPVTQSLRTAWFSRKWERRLAHPKKPHSFCRRKNRTKLISLQEI
jgi:hypothetical protein